MDASGWTSPPVTLNPLDVQKLLSLVLLAVLGLTLAAPALTGGRVSESTLPACCRRAGQHHCALHHNAPSPAGTRLAVLTERCPWTPSVPPIAHLAQWSTAPGSRSLGLLLTLLIGLAQTESLWRMALDRARGKRGPPALARAYSLRLDPRLVTAGRALLTHHDA